MKYFAGFFIALIPAVAMAQSQWTPLVKTERTTVFIDTGTLKKDGQRRQIWILQNRPGATDGILSFKGLQEYDCKEAKARSVVLMGHAAAMGNGPSVFDLQNDPRGWYPVPTGSADEKIIQFVCRLS